MGDAELLEHPSRANAIIRRAASARPRSASSTAWQRSATASTAGAPCVMRSTRTTSRQRPLARVTGLGPQSAASGAPGEHRVGAAAVARARRAAASAWSSAPRTRRPGRAGPAPARARRAPWPRRRRRRPRAGLDGGAATASAVSRSRSGAVRTASWPAKQVCHAARRADRRRSARAASTARRATVDVARGEQRLAPVELRARRAPGRRASRRSSARPEQARRERQVVALRARAGRRRRGARAARSPSARPCSSSGPSSRQVLVRLLEVPADASRRARRRRRPRPRASRRSARAARRACPSGAGDRRRRGSARGGSAAPARRGTSRRRAR